MDTYSKLPINQKSLPLASIDYSNMEINARNLVFIGINPESSEKLKIQIVAATTVDNEKLYYFFYFGNLDEYDKYHSRFMKIINSTKFITKNSLLDYLK